MSISSVFIVSPRSLRSSQAVTADGPLSTAHLPRPDPARGVFETLLVVDGRPIELDAHLDRLAISVRELFGAPAMARVAAAARVLAEAEARQTATDGAGGSSPTLARLRLTVAPDGHGKLDLAAVTADVDPATVFPAAERRVPVAPVAVRGGLGAHKWADRRLLAAASRELADRVGVATSAPGRQSVAPAAVSLIVDTDGAVLEADRANVFAVRGDAVATPPTDGRILPGVARARTIELAVQLGIGVAETPLRLDDLRSADAVFLTGSVRGVELVRDLGSPERRDDPAGPAARLSAALRERWLSGGPAGRLA